MTIPTGEPDPGDAGLAALERLLDQGDAADIPQFQAWFDSDAPVDFQTWLAGLPDIEEREAA